MSLEFCVWAVRLPEEGLRAKVNTSVAIALMAEPAKAYEQLHLVASDHDGARADRFVRLDDKLRSLISRLLPRSILGSQPFRLSGSEMKFQTESRGRPFLVPSAGFQRVFDFNCTHDNDYVCCGYLTGPFSNANASARIGADVMKMVNPFTDCSPAEMLDTLREQLDENEVRDIESQAEDEQVARMLRYWTHKEALVKATGEGVGAGLQRYNITFGPETTLWRNGLAQNDWHFHEEMLDDHLLVLAVHLPGIPQFAKLLPKLVALSMQDFVIVVKGVTI